MMKYCPSGQQPNWPSYTRTQKTMTYDAVKSAGDEGISREEICTQTGLPKQRVWFYLSELRRAGLIKRMGEAVDPTTLSAIDAKLYAMGALENAFGAAMSEMKFTKPLEKDQKYLECNRALMRYNKLKALALGEASPGSSQAQVEVQRTTAQGALRQAMIDLVKMVF